MDLLDFDWVALFGLNEFAEVEKDVVEQRRHQRTAQVVAQKQVVGDGLNHVRTARRTHNQLSGGREWGHKVSGWRLLTADRGCLRSAQFLG